MSILAKNNNLKKEKLIDLAHYIINYTKDLGATASEVNISRGHGFLVNVRKNKAETVEHSNGKNLKLGVYFGERTGVVSSNDFSEESVKLLIEKACHIAKFTSEDPYVGLAEQALMAYDYQDLKLDYPWKIEVKDAIELMKNCEDLGLSYDKHIINSEGASLDTNTAFNVYANSHDFCGATTTTSHSISCCLIAEKNQQMQRDYYYTISRDYKDLEDIKEVAVKAARRTIDRLGAKRITTCSCPVIFTPEIARGLIGSLIGAISGYNIYRKSSFLQDRLQQPILPKNITLEEDPLMPKALGSAAFDEEGVKLSKSYVIYDGILQRYLLDSYSARKLKMHTTGNAGGVHNLMVSSCKASRLDLFGLIRKMDKGLLVTEIMGDGVNIVTGDYSRGVFGYWVEGGVIQYPVIGATIAGNLQDMLLNIVDVGNDIDYRSSVLTGSILLEKMAIAG